MSRSDDSKSLNILPTPEIIFAKFLKNLNKLGLSCAKLITPEASYHFPQASWPPALLSSQLLPEMEAWVVCSL